MFLLWRKLFRDITRQKGQFLAIFLVVLIGTCIFDASFLSFSNLKKSGEATIGKLRLADLTLYVTLAPAELAAEVEKVPGVIAAEGRYVGEAEVEVPSEGERYRGRVVPLPQGEMNLVHLEEGRLPDSVGEVAVLKFFADAHGIRPGSEVFVLARGRKVCYRVAGVVHSPEYLYPLPGMNEFSAEPGSFPVVFAHPRVVEELFAPAGRINEVTVLLQSREIREEVKKKLEELGEPFGLKSVIYKEDQPGYLAFRLELLGLAELGVMFPFLFFLVAAMIIAVLSTRLVERERSQIGILRALGFTRKQIGFFYLSYGGFVGLLGVVCGAFGGYLLARELTILYSQYYALPFLVLRGDPVVLLGGGLLALGICVFSGLAAARRAIRIEPAEAMRPPLPEGGRRLPGEKLLFPYLSVWNKLAIRNIFRKFYRSLFLFLGVVSSCVVIMVAFAFYDTVDALLKKQFQEIARYDLRVDFNLPRGGEALAELEHWDGVLWGEPLLEVPVSLEKGKKKMDSEAIGLLPGFVVVTPLLPGREGQAYRVAGVADIPLGSPVFLPLGELQELSGYGSTFSGALLRVAPEHLEKIKEKAEDARFVASVEVRREAISGFQELMGMFYTFIGVMVSFGIVLAGSVIFSVAGVNFLERLRELAVLRVLGAGKGEVAGLVFRETLFLTLVGIFVGLPLGKVTAVFFMNSYNSDLMSLEAVVYPRTFLLSMAVVLMSIVLIQFLVLRQVFQVPLPEATRRTDE
jgi:putative ABC transport system permease protein